MFTRWYHVSHPQDSGNQEDTAMTLHEAVPFSQFWREKLVFKQTVVSAVKHVKSGVFFDVVCSPNDSGKYN